MKIIEYLVAAVRKAAIYNAEIQVAPACILWPDRDRQWESVVPLLQAALPELLVLGNYAPAERTGPAIWLRSALAGQVPEVSLLADKTPIIYLPGVSRQDLRAVEDCPDELKVIAELQYRGVIWSQVNAKDWTVLAYLKSDQGGLGLDVAKDNNTQEAMLRSLEMLLDTPVEQLVNKRLEATDFNQLLSSDLVRDILHWLAAPKMITQQWQGERWQAFVSLCVSEFKFNPEQEGEIAAAELLCSASGPWAGVWQRFIDAPTSYQSLVEVLSKAQPDLGAEMMRYPRYNQEEEEVLFSALQQLRNANSQQAKQELVSLEQKHAERRDWVWAELGLAPLAELLPYFKTIAEKASDSGLSGEHPLKMADYYREQYWQIDDACLRLLELAKEPTLQALVQDILDLIYTPWLDATAKNFQQLVGEKGYPGTDCKEAVGRYEANSELVFFVDGLRYDIAQRLVSKLEILGDVTQSHNWSALPSVTATAKAAVTPVYDHITGRVTDTDFQPSLLAEDKPFSSYYFKKIMQEQGWQVLADNEMGDPSGLAWVQTGDIDSAGHQDKLRLAGRIDSLLDEVYWRVKGLIEAGWKRIRIVTDHGWLLTPKPMTKVDLPKHTTSVRWARCAMIKQDAQTNLPTVNWYWNPSVTIAVAPGASAFIAGHHYDHGGLSLQECLTPIITIKSSKQQSTAANAKINSLQWLGLTCRVTVSAEEPDLKVDLRLSAADATTSVVRSKKLKDGKVSLMVADDALEGSAAVLVILDQQGGLMAQQATIIGAEE